MNWNCPGKISGTLPSIVQLLDGIAMFVVEIAVKVAPTVFVKPNRMESSGNLVTFLRTMDGMVAETVNCDSNPA